MEELKNLKYIIDDELQKLTVTEKLEKKVFKRIEKSKRFNFGMKYNWLRLSTVFSLMVILFTFGINTIYNKNSINNIENGIVQYSNIDIPRSNKLLVSESYFQRFTIMDNFDEEIIE